MSRVGYIREVGWREYVSVVTGGWREWLALPRLCKFGRHLPARRDHWNEDAHAFEEIWRECSRCGLYLGHDFHASVGWIKELIS